MRMVVVLPAPLRPEEAVDLASADVEVERVDREHVAVALRERAGGDGGRGFTFMCRARGCHALKLNHVDVASQSGGRRRGVADARRWAVPNE